MSISECRDHYYNYYIHGSVGKVTFPNEHKFDKVTDHTLPENGPLSPTLTSPQPPVELTPQEISELGYMPLRDDFERVRLLSVRFNLADVHRNRRPFDIRKKKFWIGVANISLAIDFSYPGLTEMINAF